MSISSYKGLFKRYREAWRHAWLHRKQFDAKSFSTDETAFMPAVLSLQETPPSPLPRAIMWAMIGFAACALTWAVFGKIDIVATAEGKIVTNERTKAIAPMEAGMVKSIHVSDGQQVNEGDVLIELDGVQSQSDMKRIENDLTLAKLQVARGRSLLKAIESEDTSKLVLPEINDKPLWSEASVLLQSQYDEYLSHHKRIDAELEKRKAECFAIQDNITKLDNVLPIAKQKLSDYKKLFDKNYVSKHAYLENQQKVIEQEADLATLRNRYKESEASLQEGLMQKEGLVAEMRRVNLESVNEGLQKITTLEQELSKTQSRLQSMKLISPVDGTVQQLAVHTIGGVVTSAQTVMLVVPQNEPIEVEAFIENKDIGFIRSGQLAAVKLETFPYTKYGTIDAEVMSVSNDAINDEKRGLIYSTRVKMQRGKINIDGKWVNLTPGMAVTVEVKTGKRRVIEYFLSPLLQHAQESFHER